MLWIFKKIFFGSWNATLGIVLNLSANQYASESWHTMHQMAEIAVDAAMGYFPRNIDNAGTLIGLDMLVLQLMFWAVAIAITVLLVNIFRAVLAKTVTDVAKKEVLGQPE